MILVYQFYGNMYTDSDLSVWYSGLYNLQENHMLYSFHYEFYFLVHCLGYAGHDFHETQTYQNLDNFGHSCYICHLLVLYDKVYM